MLFPRIAALTLVVTIYCLPLTSYGALVGLTGGENVDSVFYEIDPLSGQVLRQLGATGLTGLSSFAVHPTTGMIYAHQNSLWSDTGQLHRIDPRNFASTVVGTTHVSVDDLVFTADGTLLGWMAFHDGTVIANQTIYELVSLDLATGAPTIIGSSDLLTYENGLALSPDGQLYLKGINGNAGAGGNEQWSEVYLIDPTTANSTLVNRLHDAASGPGFDIYPRDVLAFDDAGVAFTVTRNYDTSNPFNHVFQSSFLQTIDLTTGAVTTIGGDLGLEFTALAFNSSITAVPEPTGTGMLVTLIGYVAFRRSRSRCPRRRRFCFQRSEHHLHSTVSTKSSPNVD